MNPGWFGQAGQTDGRELARDRPKLLAKHPDHWLRVGFSTSFPTLLAAAPGCRRRPGRSVICNMGHSYDPHRWSSLTPDALLLGLGYTPLLRPLPPQHCLRPTRGEHTANPRLTLVVPVANPGRSSGNPFEYTPPDDHPLNPGYWESTAAIPPTETAIPRQLPPPRLPATTSASGSESSRAHEDVHRGSHDGGSHDDVRCFIR